MDDWKSSEHRRREEDDTLSALQTNQEASKKVLSKAVETPSPEEGSENVREEKTFVLQQWGVFCNMEGPQPISLAY